LSSWDEKTALAAEHQRAVRRARRSLELLKLEGVQGLDKLEQALAQAGEKPEDPARMQRLAEELPRAWAQLSSRTRGTGP
jgi:hypothetical protein